MFGSLTRLGAWLFVVVWVLGSVEAWWFCWRPKPWKNDVLNVTPATILLWSLRQFNVWLEFTWSNCCCEAFLYLQFIHCNAGNTRSLEKELGKFFEYRHPGEWLNQILIVSEFHRHWIRWITFRSLHPLVLVGRISGSPEEAISEAKKLGLHLPAPNPFIPEDLEQKEVKKPNPALPQRLQGGKVTSYLFHRQDDQFLGLDSQNLPVFFWQQRDEAQVDDSLR